MKIIRWYWFLCRMILEDVAECCRWLAAKLEGGNE